ncbi:hypothetical protein HaLaN_16765 [Haematococcus lacustris]|uniref:Uncharacterized protein n=1 Tax=Haematococcus lacustris TaxID=44745 RepID=A0A699ZMM3_HAELA|nr:hypothetical protein HaLaN_16765 [Haematococcus lacustris]
MPPMMEQCRTVAGAYCPRAIATSLRCFDDNAQQHSLSLSAVVGCARWQPKHMQCKSMCKSLP